MLLSFSFTKGEEGLGSQNQIPALCLRSSVTLSKLLSLSEPPLFDLYNGENNAHLETL